MLKNFINNIKRWSSNNMLTLREITILLIITTLVSLNCGQDSSLYVNEIGWYGLALYVLLFIEKNARNIFFKNSKKKKFKFLVIFFNFIKDYGYFFASIVFLNLIYLCKVATVTKIPVSSQIFEYADNKFNKFFMEWLNATFPEEIIFKYELKYKSTYYKILNQTNQFEIKIQSIEGTEYIVDFFRTINKYFINELNSILSNIITNFVNWLYRLYEVFGIYSYFSDNIWRDVINYCKNFVIFIENNIFLDGISLWLGWLTMLVGFVVTFSGSKKRPNFSGKEFESHYYFNRFIRFSIILTLICFLTKDIFIFFISFEMILIPLFSYLILRGSRFNKIQAVKYLFVYTIVGSLFLWYNVAYIVDNFGVSNYNEICWEIFMCNNSGKRFSMFVCFFLGFAFKVPLVPFHHWLTVAHVEAPTNGSIVLAALLLKIGGYGMYRFVYSPFLLEVYDYKYLLMGLSAFGFTYATWLSIRQIDIKRYIAYTSIAHMNYALLGLFSCKDVGVLGFIHIMISHGIIATALFFLIGQLYSGLSYRDTLRLGGLAYLYPKFSIFFFIFSVANMGLPLFSGFPGEFLIFVAVVNTSEFYAFIIFFGFMLSGVYNLFQLNKILFSSYSNSIYLKKNGDLNHKSVSLLSLLVFWSLVLGLCPDIVIQNVNISYVK